MGPNRPTLECELSQEGERVRMPDMVDTGADITVISCRDWPQAWELKSVAGNITGVGGRATALRSTQNVTIQSPEGNSATIRPFIIDAGFTLWGRDTLSQWGTRVVVPAAQDF